MQTNSVLVSEEFRKHGPVSYPCTPLKEARKESKLPKIKFAAKGERVEVRRGTSARY